MLLLVFAAAASAFTGEWVDATIVLVIVAATVVIGYSRELPSVRILGFVPLSFGMLAALTAITVLYIAATEILKAWFYRGTRPNSG